MISSINFVINIIVLCIKIYYCLSFKLKVNITQEIDKNSTEISPTFAQLVDNFFLNETEIEFRAAPPPSQRARAVTTTHTARHDVLSEISNNSNIAMRRARDQLLSLKSEAIDGLSRLTASEAQVLALKTRLKEVKQTFLKTIEGLMTELLSQKDVIDGHIRSAGTKNITELRAEWKRLDNKMIKLADLEGVAMDWDAGHKPPPCPRVYNYRGHGYGCRCNGRGGYGRGDGYGKHVVTKL